MVHFLLTDRHSNFFLAIGSPETGDRRLCVRFRDPLRLCARHQSVELVRVRLNRRFAPNTVTAAVHRFEESIAGRPYLIEVAAVSKDRWRAYIVRIPGVPTALMPFYGSTPVEAAHLLCDWLTRAYARASAPPGPAGSV
jgi:hypothetical protein